MQATLPRGQIVTLSRACASLAQVRGSARWAYALARTGQHLRPEVDAVTEAIKAFDAQRVALCAEYAAKDEAGEPIVTDGQYQITDPAAFDLALAKLREAEGIDGLLDDQVEVTLHGLRASDIPDNVTPAEISALLPMLVDEDE